MLSTVGDCDQNHTYVSRVYLDTTIHSLSLERLPRRRAIHLLVLLTPAAS